MTIKSWPLEHRPRERLLLEGAETLSDAELLAVILRTGVTGSSAVELGQALLSHCGGMHALLHASAKQLQQIKGIGLAKLAQLQAVLELARRALIASLRTRKLLSSSRQVKTLLRLSLAKKTQEVFLCLFLDTQSRLITMVELFHGTLAETSVYPREVVRQAIHYNACSIIIAHNHPDGIAKPSLEDMQLTLEIHKSMALIDVILVDHFIVAGKKVFSFMQSGLLSHLTPGTNDKQTAMPDLAEDAELFS